MSVEININFYCYKTPIEPKDPMFWDIFGFADKSIKFDEVLHISNEKGQTLSIYRTNFHTRGKLYFKYNNLWIDNFGLYRVASNFRNLLDYYKANEDRFMFFFDMMYGMESSKNAIINGNLGENNENS